jgi:hypothetical protein
MTLAMNPVNNTDLANITVADSLYFDTGEPPRREPDPDSLMPTSHFVVVLAIPVAVFVLAVVAGWQGWLSWWWAIPLAILGTPLVAVAATLGYDHYADLYSPRTTAAAAVPDTVPASMVVPRRRQSACRDHLGEAGLRKDRQQHCFERAQQPKATKISELAGYSAAPWWNRKASTAAQLRGLDQTVWRSYAKLQDNDHVASGPAGLFSIHDLHMDNISVLPTSKPQTDVPALFDDVEATATLAILKPVTPQWIRIAPASTTETVHRLNALPHMTSTCTMATTNDGRSVDQDDVIPASALETQLLVDAIDSGVNPDQYTVVLVAHGADMSNPWEYVELSYGIDDVGIGGAWLVHPNRVTEFLNSRPVTVTDRGDLLYNHDLAANA